MKNSLEARCQNLFGRYLWGKSVFRTAVWCREWLYVYTCGRSVNIVTKRQVLMHYHYVDVFDRILDVFEIRYKCGCPESTLQVYGR